MRIEPGAILVGWRANRSGSGRTPGCADPPHRSHRGGGLWHGRWQGGGNAERRPRDDRGHRSTLGAGVDIVGNVLEHTTLERANVRAASAVVLALNSDSEGVFCHGGGPRLRARGSAHRSSQPAPNVARLYCGRRRFRLSLGQMAGKFSPTICWASRRWLWSRVFDSSGWRRARWSTASVAFLARTDRCGGGRGGAGSERVRQIRRRFPVGPNDVLFVCGTLGSLEQHGREFQVRPPKIHGLIPSIPQVQSTRRLIVGITGDFETTRIAEFTDDLDEALPVLREGFCGGAAVRAMT